MCDKYGMLVIDEFTDTWTSGKAEFGYSMYITEWWEHDIENMVRKDYNHPCVIMYSIGNEIPELGNCFDVQRGKRFADRLKALDPCRYVTNGINILMAVGDQLAHEKPDIPEEGETQPNEINMLMNFLGANLESIINSEKAGQILGEAGRDKIRTAGTPHLEMKADVKTIPADGRDIGYVDFYLRDENGVLNGREPQITIEAV